MSYSIFVRDLARTDGGAPQLLAYDIHDRSMAALAGVGDRHIVSGPRLQPGHPGCIGSGPTAAVHEIYTWPQA